MRRGPSRELQTGVDRGVDRAGAFGLPSMPHSPVFKRSGRGRGAQISCSWTSSPVAHTYTRHTGQADELLETRGRRAGAGGSRRVREAPLLARLPRTHAMRATGCYLLLLPAGCLIPRLLRLHIATVNVHDIC